MHGIAKEGAQWDPSEWSLIALTGTRRHLRGPTGDSLEGIRSAREARFWSAAVLLPYTLPAARRAAAACDPPINPRDPPGMRGGAVRSRCALLSAAPVLSRDLLQHCGAPPLCDTRSEGCCCGLRPPHDPPWGVMDACLAALCESAAPMLCPAAPSYSVGQAEC